MAPEPCTLTPTPYCPRSAGRACIDAGGCSRAINHPLPGLHGFTVRSTSTSTVELSFVVFIHRRCCAFPVHSISTVRRREGQQCARIRVLQHARLEYCETMEGSPLMCKCMVFVRQVLQRLSAMHERLLVSAPSDACHHLIQLQGMMLYHMVKIVE